MYFYLLYILLGIMGLALIYYSVKSHRKCRELQLREDDLLDNSSQEIKTLESRVLALKKVESLGILAASLAHEIKNPVNVILNSSKVLKREANSKELDGDCERAKSLINQMADIIVDNSLKIDKIVSSLLENSGSVSTSSFEDVVIGDLIDKVLKETQALMLDKFQRNIDIDLDVKFDSKGRVNISVVDFQRLFTNMMENSYYSILKKEKENPGFKGKITIVFDRDQKFHYIHYKDNGLGVSEKDLEKIGRPFFTTKPRGEGVGLGMYLVKDITALHAGSLSIDSKEGEFFSMDFKFLRRFH